MNVAQPGRRLVLGLCLACVLAASSTTTTTTRAEPAPASDTIAPGDLLCVGIWDLTPGPELLKTVRVGADGSVSLFYIKPVKVGGLTFEAAERALATAYREAGVAARPAPSINRLEQAADAKVKPGPIAAGDRVSVRLGDLAPNEWTERILTVRDDGGVGLPVLGSFKVGGLTEGQAEAAIAKEFRDRGLVRDAAVSVLRLAPDQAAEPTVQAPERGSRSGPKGK